MKQQHFTTAPTWINSYYNNSYHYDKTYYDLKRDFSVSVKDNIA